MATENKTFRNPAQATFFQLFVEAIGATTRIAKPGENMMQPVRGFAENARKRLSLGSGCPRSMVRARGTDIRPTLINHLPWADHQPLTVIIIASGSYNRSGV